MWAFFGTQCTLYLNSTARAAFRSDTSMGVAVVNLEQLALKED